MRQSGQAASEREARRYLAEMPWLPHAMLANRQLDWREIDTRALDVATSVGSARVAVQLDAAGDIVSAFSAARPHSEGETKVPRAWGGVLRNYDVLGRVRVPTRAAVRWELPEGPFTYWRGTLTSAEWS